MPPRVLTAAWGRTPAGTHDVKVSPLTQSTLVIPVQATTRILEAVRGILSDHGISHAVARDLTGDVDDADLDGRLVAVIVGGSLDSALLDALRWCTARSIPTLVLVREVDDVREARLLTSGAFDVLGLPTSGARLGARLLALHRNVEMIHQSDRRGHTGDMQVGDLNIDLGRREVHVGDVAVHLTKTEFDLLALLARDPQHVFTRSELRDLQTHGPARTASLESHLSRIRRKIREAGGGPVIEVVRGVGYRLGEFGRITA